MDGPPNLLVLGFGDLAEVSAPQHHALQALAPPGVLSVLVGADWPEGDGAQLERLAALAEDADRLICLGVGAGGFAALLFGRLLGASAIFAAAPGADHGRPIGLADLDDLAAVFADTDLAAAPYVRVLTAEDSQAMDLALVERLRREGVALEVDAASLGSRIVPLALAQSGAWAGQIAAWAAGEPVPGLGDLKARWRHAFAHVLELDLDAAYQDVAGALHLSGRLRNGSDRALDLGLATAECVRVGARLYPRGGDSQILLEARGAFSGVQLEPGSALGFHIALPCIPEDAGRLDIALVCDGRLWLDTAGFPLERLTLGAADAADDAWAQIA